VLTDAGTTYYHQVTRLLNELVEADASVSDTGLEPHGSLRVTMPVAYGGLCVGPHIGAFLKRYPKVELDVLLTDAVTWWLSGSTSQYASAQWIAMLVSSHENSATIADMSSRVINT
jgi:DNA-binding transcriptional LysR family regulator